jgi:hypothetical protein
MHARDDRLGPAVLAAVAALAAAVGAGVALILTNNQAPTAVVRTDDGSLPAIAALRNQVEELGKRLDALPAVSAADAPATASVERHDALAQAEAQQALQLAKAIEARVAQLEQRAAAGPPADVGRPRPPLDAAALAAETARRQNDVLDPNSTAAVKLEAWRWMRHQKDSWNDAVVAQMVDLGLTSTDAKVRADVWRQADGNQRHAGLVPALLAALQRDADANVREEAAETLEGYYDRPEVQQALDYSSRNDQDPRVRRQATQTIASALQPPR